MQQGKPNVKVDTRWHLKPVEGEEAMGSHSHSSKLFERCAAVHQLNQKALEENRIVAWNKGHACTRPFDMLRTNVLRIMHARKWRTLAITSPSEESGKTTVAINLAFSLAYQLGPDVVLVELDLRQPTVASCLGIEPRGNLKDFLEWNTPLSADVVSAGGAELRVVAGQKSRHHATELLASAQIDQLIGEFGQERSNCLGIFDLPPLLSTDDALSVLPRLDCVLMVVGEGVTKKAEVNEALRLELGTNLIGVVLNRSRSKMRSYY